MSRVHMMSVSAAALLIGSMAATPAAAFDEISWTWNNNVTTTLTVDLADPGAATPTIAEGEQTFVGSTTSVSVAGAVVPALGLSPGGTPEVSAVATSVNNNMSISSDQNILADATQLSYGGLAVGASLDLLSLASLSLDLVTPSAVTATATSVGTDMVVDSSATGVANNFAIDGVSMSISNAQQFAVANVTATATSTGVAVLSDSITVNAAATAVGNNAAITVVTPVI